MGHLLNHYLLFVQKLLLDLLRSLHSSTAVLAEYLRATHSFRQSGEPVLEPTWIAAMTTSTLSSRSFEAVIGDPCSPRWQGVCAALGSGGREEKCQEGQRGGEGP
jgi:hypothetical protein